MELRTLSCFLAVLAILAIACEGSEPAPTASSAPNPTSVSPAVVIAFPDANLAASIGSALGKRPGEAITAGDCAGLTVLYATSREIADLSGLEYCTSPQGHPAVLLYLEGNQIGDISPLVENRGLGPGAFVNLLNNNLDLRTCSEDLANIRALQVRGVDVAHDRVSADRVVSTPDSTFRDPCLERAVRQALGKPRGEALRSAELAGLTELRVAGSSIADLTGVESLTDLALLDVTGCPIGDISPLASLSNLTELKLSWNQEMSDISPLASLSSLNSLELQGNRNTDISRLSSLSQVTSLNLERNQIDDLSPLANLANLTALYLEGNRISDIAPLANLTELTSLYLERNQVSDISPFVSLTNLTSLSLEGNQISDISPLASLTSLGRLNLQGNRISDISPLSKTSALESVDEIDLRWNDLDLSPGSEDLAIIAGLQDRGITVHSYPQRR